MSGRIRERNVEGITKAKSVKHAEYEIIKVMLYDGWRPIDHIHLDRLYCKLVPEVRSGNGIKTSRFGWRDQHAAKRFETACNNIGSVMRTMLSKRVKHLPEEHEDYLPLEEWLELDEMRVDDVRKSR